MWYVKRHFSLNYSKFNLNGIFIFAFSPFIFAEPPTNLRITDITKNTISLAWEKPNYDGGSPITGYMIEKREGANSKWSKANLTNITDTRFTVTGLTQDETYEFRVMAKNAVGSISNPSITAGPATCVDTYGKFLGFFYVYINIFFFVCIFFCIIAIVSFKKNVLAFCLSLIFVM